jgi:Ras-related protein Rab-1A
MVSQCDGLIFKVLLLGDSNVGKTCFLLRYIEDTFTNNHISTIGVDYKLKMISSTNDSRIIKLQIWDTAGQERFRSITKNYYKSSNGIFLIYDVTNQSSFNNIKNWISQIKDYIEDDICITLVGNKIDLGYNRKISLQEGRKLAKENNFSFFEVSAKENINVHESFEDLTKEMLEKTKLKESNIKLGSSNLLDKNKKKVCCN